MASCINRTTGSVCTAIPAESFGFSSSGSTAPRKKNSAEITNTLSRNKNRLCSSMCVVIFWEIAVSVGLVAMPVLLLEPPQASHFST